MHGMTGGRIESEHRDIAFDDAARRGSGQVAEIKPPDMSPVPGGMPAARRDFERLIGIAGRRASEDPARSPRQHIADFVTPMISDPTVFQGDRSVSILERLASDILPHLDESEELRSLAGALIADEIERHRSLLTRLHGGIAA